MISFPNCKINLGLQIEGKRSDGFHAISSIMYPLPFEEILEIVEISGSGNCEFESSGLNIPGDKASNLCVKAYELLNKIYGLPSVHIHLHKIIPMGGGLGGGSSDAAETIKSLNTIFDLKLTTGQMKSYASQLGSDCPFFIENTPQLAKGRGEILTPINLSLKGYKIALVNDGTHINTKNAYAGVTPKEPDFKLDRLTSLPIEEWKNHLVNDFEESVFKHSPHLRNIKEELYNQGAVYAAMSGSGATIFGMFEGAPYLSSLKNYHLNKVVTL